MENKKTLEDALADMEARNAEIAELKRKHGPALDAAIEKSNALNARLAALPQAERRKVLDAAGMKHISAAPPPLEPLRGSSYSPPSKPTSPPIDWEHWGLMREVPLWHAVALSVNISPEVVKLDRAGEAFDKRLNVALSHVNAGSLPLVLHYANQPVSPVLLARFAAWAVSLHINNMPPELAALAQSQKPEAEAPPVAPAATLTLPPADMPVLKPQTDDTGLSKREKQIRAIEAEARSAGYDHLNIKTGCKTILRNACKTSLPGLFGAGDDPFNDAWKAATKCIPPRLQMADHKKFARL